MRYLINPDAIQDNSIAKDKLDTSLRSEIDNKQEALTLTVKDNGNIVLANIQGQSKEFMPATPSGDPMHYAYVAAGAEYNDTGEDIVKTTPWADMLDDDYDGPYGKTVVHKAGYWYLNGLGDITNDEIRKIYQLTSIFPETQSLIERLSNYDIRTNFNIKIINGFGSPTINAIAYNSRMPIINLTINSNTPFDGSFSFSNRYLIHCIGYVGRLSFFNAFSDSIIHTIKLIKLSNNVNIPSPNLSVKSVLYMITNETATEPITITLNADVYNRCMANADILTALQAHTNVSLASA